MTEPFIIKYRPKTLEEVWGHQEALNALSRTLKMDSRPHCYLLTGPSGVGKTTIARIIGAMLGAEIHEIDAASYSGVDSMRELVELSQYMSLSGSGNQMYIIDECHSLSRSAWQALLKLAEEPPPHFYVALCTTEPDKVPNTIAEQRAYPITLKPLSPALIEEFLIAVCRAEGWSPAGDVMTAVIHNSDGSPRKALTLMLTVHDLKDRNELRRVISLQDAGEPIIQIAQLLSRPGSRPPWSAFKPHLAKMDDDEFDRATTQIGRYLMNVMIRANDEKVVMHIKTRLDALTFPIESFDPKLRFYVALGRMIWE